ncbi:MAG: methylenetetrahydrofolate--tRNA-(uracil(54)-C(5))-methyltransferase (FADH(2)-oxidizing) TrmFO, partial [Deltaproteobacteria bacterium]|nr:methylenetetrahydrofolate--tRNA-(uracil(54)-C(5))-methyltransferase (FADH(2)-oxidizing) TrmFO [Deltaproteobacteria bacterium]
GALMTHLSDANPKHFQPMNVNFGLFPPLDEPLKRGRKKRPKREKNEAHAARALAAITAYVHQEEARPA